MEGSGNKNQINDNIFSREFNFNAGNPFNNGFGATQNSTPPTQPPSATNNPIKRINGYDSTILNNTQFDQNEGEELSIEYRIKEKETTKIYNTFSILSISLNFLKLLLDNNFLTYKIK